MAQCRKKLSKLAKRNEQARLDIEKLQEEEPDDSKPFKMKLRTKWSLSWRPENCEHAKVDEAATRHKLQTGVVEQSRRGSNSQVFGVRERQQRQFTRGTHQKGNHAGSSQPRREHEERWMKSSGNRRPANIRLGRLLLFTILLCSQTAMEAKVQK